MSKTIVIGATAGLILGLILWLDSSARRPVVATTTAGETVASRPAAEFQGPRTLSGSARPANETDEPHETLVEGPRATALRHIWTARLPVADYAGALDVIVEGGLDSSERSAHLLELGDSLVRPDWIPTTTFPRSLDVEALYKKPGGRKDLESRWTVANALVDHLPPEAGKIGLLARLELFARVLADAAERPATPLPSMTELDEAGRPKPAPASASATPTPTPAESGPLFDVESEVARLRSTAAAELRRIESTSFLASCWREARSSWNLLRTCLLSAIGAGVGLLTKTYAEGIARRIQRHTPFGLIDVEAAAKVEGPDA